jgi:hypothetical protein
MDFWNLRAPPVTSLTWPVPIDPKGKEGPTPGQGRGPHWRRTSLNRYVPASVTDDLVEQRILEQYERAGPDAVVTAWAALRLCGADYFDGLDQDGRTKLPVPIACNGERIRAHPDFLMLRFTVPPDEVVLVHGIRCASIERALYDEMRRRGTKRGMVVAADMTFAAGLTSIIRMRRYAASRRWYRDVRRVNEALGLCDEHARSGPEVSLRLVWDLDAGWGHPLCNRSVFDLDGRFVAIPDLIDPVRGVVGEFAGAHHRDIDRHESDICREADLRDVGLEYVEAVGRDLSRTTRLVRRLHEAERRARASTLPQRWVLGPPPSRSLDEVLDRRDASSDTSASWTGVPDDRGVSLDGDQAAS